MSSLDTGIKPNGDMSDLITSTMSPTNLIRSFSCKIEKADNPVIELVNQHKNSGATDDQEFDKAMINSNIFNSAKPHYIFYRLDNDKWILILYLPDGNETSRWERMIYSSTIGSLRQAFGHSRISSNFTLTTPAEVKWSKIQSDHLDKGKKVDLLSDAEKRLQQTVNDEEATRSDYIKSGAVLQSGTVAFAFSGECESAVQSFASDGVNFVQMKLDIKTEVINCLKSENLSDYSKVESLIPKDFATFNILKHTCEHGTHTIFFMCMPSTGLKVKEKMLNASCKNGVHGKLDALGVTVNKNMEINDGSEVSAVDLLKLVAPADNTDRTYIKKPSRPGGRPAGRRPR